ncbi:hypothetical protein FRC12_024109 [Ceratobasidium sp. 428]|nr:hypothetical protein FRC12_024109 [Ceratobasidium sp. 428]
MVQHSAELACVGGQRGACLGAFKPRRRVKSESWMRQDETPMPFTRTFGSISTLSIRSLKDKQGGPVSYPSLHLLRPDTLASPLVAGRDYEPVSSPSHAAQQSRFQ